MFPVAMVHSTLLVQLRDPASRLLAYDPPPADYTGPVDDIIVLAHSAQQHGVQMYIDNRRFYGFLLPPLDDDKTLQLEQSEFVHLKLQNIGETSLNEKKTSAQERRKHCSRTGCSTVRTPPARPQQTGPITIHCAAASSVIIQQN